MSCSENNSADPAESSGLALLYVLVLVALMGLALAAFGSRLRSSIRIAAAGREYSRTASAARNALGSYLAATEAGVPHGLGQLRLDRIAANVWSALSTARSPRSSAAARLILAGPRSGAHVLNWSALEARIRPPDESCLQWRDTAPAELASQEKLSLRSCTRLQAPLDTSVLLHGNLVLPSELNIGQLSDQRLYLVVLGTVVLEEGIVLEETRNFALELIAAGDIRLGSIRHSGAERSFVHLHSAGGSVHIAAADAIPSGCDPAQALTLTIESPGSRVIGGRPLDPTSLQRSCGPPREASIWPPLKVLGEAVE